MFTPEVANVSAKGSVMVALIVAVHPLLSVTMTA